MVGCVNWTSVAVKALGEVITGKTPSRDNPEDWGTSVPFVTPTDFGAFGKFADVTLRSLSVSGVKNLEKKVLPEESILVTCIGSDMGKVALTRRAVVTNQQINAVVPNKSLVDADFLYYRFVDMHETLRLLGGDGTTMPILNKGDFEQIELLLPPLPEQKAIASVLSSLDDKIDLLHRQNKTLEAMAETLFRQWFVEEADEGWEEGTLSDIAEINPSRTLPKGQLAPYLEMSNVNESVFHPKDWIERECGSGMKFRNGDTLLARITPCLENGKTCYVSFLDNDQVGWGSTEFIVLRMKEPFHPFISYLLARNSDFREFAIGCLAGTSGRQRVQGSVVAQYELRIPKGDVVGSLNEICESFVSRLDYNAQQIRTLTQLRDTLLPKLMSGEVRVAV